VSDATFLSVAVSLAVNHRFVPQKATGVGCTCLVIQPMTESEPAAQEPAAMSADSRTDPVESFVSVVTDALAESGADQDTIESVENHGSRMVEHVDGLRDENEQLSERVEQLESELESVRDRAGRDRAELSSRVTELEETVDESQDGSEETDSNPAERDETPTPDGPSPPKTGLEEIVRLPAGVATDTLTANEQRARSVARDLGDYCDYNHQYGTYSLTASTLRKVLTAQSDGDGSVHAQTVKRVRQFLSRLGSDSVSVVEDSGGTRRITFAESLVDRIESWVEDHGGVTAETDRVGVKP